MNLHNILTKVFVWYFLPKVSWVTVINLLSDKFGIASAQA